MAIYNTTDDAWQVSVDNRLQGWQVQVSAWDGENFDVRYDRYAICESLNEAVIDALTASGMDWETADWQTAEWGILAPSDDDYEN